ncbi:MAG TPA: heme biosynthesis HemY N-terminal domain-containing protein, partial [Casimicrobiaceae bacterium]|nr:heme biosynthesis HemY N-terminal domain-containing protein [Casimicrobiaceae bacterium]
MRILFAFLLLAALAVLVALLFRLNAGYVLFVAPPYRVEITLNAFIVAVVAAFVALHLILRLAARVARLPDEVRETRRRRNLERARGKQDASVVALLEGRYGKARQYAEEALAIPQSTGLPALVGARAAVDMREFAQAESLLARPDAGVTSLAVPRLMLEADMALAQDQPGTALEKLAQLKREAGLHTAALRLEVRALTAAKRYVDIPPIVDQLVKRK